MLKSLKLKNFTLFADADFHFGKNLNVIVGENGSGKSHILKAAYTAIAVSAELSKGGVPSKSQLQMALAEKLIHVFRPDRLGRLVRRGGGRKKCALAYKFVDSKLDLEMGFSTLAEIKVEVQTLPNASTDKRPVFLPTRELLTIAPGFVALYDDAHLRFEETWRDTCLLLEAPLARGPREAKIKKLLRPLEAAMDGKVEVENGGRFYLNTSSGKMEMYIVAEGLRKLAMIARLIATGSLLDKGYLFWDEPEANLNPRIIKAIARVIMELAGGGIQVFVATHSLFLLRELHILQKQEFMALKTKCFGLHVCQDGSVEVKQGQTMDEIGDITSLDEDLQQSDRYIDAEMDLKPKAADPGTEK